MNYLLVFIVSFVITILPSASDAQSTVSTPIVGFEKRAFEVGTTGLGAGFVKPAVFVGTASSVGANTITVTGANFGNLGPSNGLVSYYAEITSGSMAGYVLDITSNTTTVLTVDGSLSSISATTPSITVRPHLKVSDIFAGNNSLADFADTVVVYHSDGSTSSVLRDSSSSTGWVDINTFAETDLVVYPGQGFLLNSSGSGQVTVSGQVKTTPTVIPLYAGVVNLVSPGNPSGNPALQASQLGQNMSDFVDTVATFSTNGAFSQTATYLWGGSTDGFIDINTFNPVSGVTLPGTGTFLVSVQNDTTWKALPPINP